MLNQRGELVAEVKAPEAEHKYSNNTLQNYINNGYLVIPVKDHRNNNLYFAAAFSMLYSHLDNEKTNDFLFMFKYLFGEENQFFAESVRFTLLHDYNSDAVCTMDMAYQLIWRVWKKRVQKQFSQNQSTAYQDEPDRYNQLETMSSMLRQRIIVFSKDHAKITIDDNYVNEIILLEMEGVDYFLTKWPLQCAKKLTQPEIDAIDSISYPRRQHKQTILFV